MAGFSKKVVALAQESEKKYGVPASVTLAQYALESGYGSSSLAQNNKNYFGIKGSYNGQSRNGFRVYSSIEESFDDHGALLAKPLYADKTKGADTIEEYVRAFAETYAPSSDGNSNYAGKIMQIINSNNLTQYDSGAWRSGGGGNSTTTTTTTAKSSVGNTILGSIISFVTLAAIAIMAAVFFMTAFDLHMPSKAVKS